MKHLNKLIAIILCAFITLSAAPALASFITQAAETSFSPGDIIEFGSFPQTLVTAEELIEELTIYTAEAEWQPLGWYKGTSDFGTMYETDDGKYYDFFYMGEKYRAYLRTANRAVFVYNNPALLSEPELCFFKFEPIQWVIADTETGLLITKNILDSQAYSNTIYEDSSTSSKRYYYDAEMTSYCSNWATSSLRTYLNVTFFNTAFNTLEQSLVKETELDNPSAVQSNTEYSYENTVDKVFVQSYLEAAAISSTNSSYMKKVGTDYAIKQGLYTPDDTGASLYWLRSAYDSRRGSEISINGYLSRGGDTFTTDWGVAPSLQIDLNTYDSLDLYEDIDVEFNNGILTVQGNGVLPNPENSLTRILAPYKEITTAVIIKDGITEISENAFDGFIEMKTLILEGNTVLQDNSLPDSFQLSTVIIKDTVAFNGNPFAPDIYYINVFKIESATLTYESLAEGVSVYTYLYKNGNIDVAGSVTMNTYEFFDFMAVMCGDFSDVETVSFDSFTSTDLRFYAYDSTTGEKTMLPDSVVSGAIFSVEVSNNDAVEKVTFNTLCDMAAEGTLDELYLITESETVGEIEDTEMEINSLEDLITYALKWIVSLMNFFFSLFSRFR